MKQYSLRRQLISRISYFFLAATIIVFALSYYSSRHEIEEVYDAQLVHSAKVLLQLTQHEVMQDAHFDLGLENQDFQHKYERKLAFRVWSDNALVTQSPSASGFKDFAAPPGFSDHDLNGKGWRFFVLIDAQNNIRIEVSERYDVRHELILELMLSLIVPALILIPLILFIIWGGVRSALRPVDRLSNEVDSRSSDDFSPIGGNAAPIEIMPFIGALNRMLGRLELSFRREREFTDHAAHELRTPLAAMKTQTQVLIRKAKGLPEYAEGLENLNAAINRSTHLVDQLLSMARLQHEELDLDVLDISNILEDVIKTFALRAKDKNITLETVIAERVYIKGHADYLPIMLGNIVDNAIKYTPEKGKVTITLHTGGVLTIADTGQGLSDDDKARVFDRFVRADKTGQIGSGLGLSIARSIADAHKIHIKLYDNKPKGIVVRLEWQEAV